MPHGDFGSLTKEPPLATLDATIEGVSPGMPYSELLEFGRRSTHRDAPGLIRKRFLLLDPQHRIVYDRFLALSASDGLQSPRVRKVMYFVWAFRDERLRRSIPEIAAHGWRNATMHELMNWLRAPFFERFPCDPSTRKTGPILHVAVCPAGARHDGDAPCRNILRPKVKRRARERFACGDM